MKLLVERPSLELMPKDTMWKAATAGTVREFEFHIKKIKDMDPENQKTYKWLQKVNPAYWTKSHFNTNRKCDVLVNNMSESFNGYILEARDKPIISMIEWIRKKLMNRFQVKRQGMEKYEGPICPVIQDKLEKIKVQARNCFPSFSGDEKFEVDFYDTTYGVDLKARTCGCRLWDLTGIPCKHAVSAIYIHRSTPETFVHPCYSKDTYLQYYSFMINPVPGQHDWLETNMDPIVPPIMRIKPGRPKKVRRRGVDEPTNPYRVSRKNKYITCGKCGKQGHNSRSCKPSIPVKGKVSTRVRSSQASTNSQQSVVSNVQPPNTSNVQPLQLKKGQASTSSQSGVQPLKLKTFGGKGIKMATVRMPSTKGSPTGV